MAERDWNQEAHNQGQEDGAAGHYHNPYGSGLGGLVPGDLERAEKYDQGYKSGRDGD